MDSRNDEISDNMPNLGQLVEEVSMLSDLFRRRLMDDKQRNQLYDALVEQNKKLNNQIEVRNFDAFVKELILICDRIEASEYKTDFVSSIFDELQEVLRRRGVERILDLSKFDPSLHEAIEVVLAENNEEDNKIVAVKRHGYRVGERLIRPAEVVVAIKREDSAEV